jgi:osmotically-inducible protein OsmY
LSVAQLPQYSAYEVSAHSDESDRNDELAEIMYDALKATGRGELRRVTVKISGERVILKGTVHTYFTKQAAQEAVRPHLFEGRIQNDLVVDS